MVPGHRKRSKAARSGVAARTRPEAHLSLQVRAQIVRSAERARARWGYASASEADARALRRVFQLTPICLAH
ncbi:MAG: hypothetical protein ACJAYU_001341 [Bradymonadia bacterium]|jgi:hypothetical protein